MSNDKIKKERPSFFGNDIMRYNVNFDNNEDDVGNLTTRRIDFTPSISPIVAMPSINSKNENISVANKLVSSSTPSKGMHQSSSSSSSSWNLTEAPTVPAFGHPLEPSSVLVPNETASEIARRVSHILEQQLTMIEIEYDENQADCRTSDNVEFAVNLYSASGPDAGGIIVEVQRFSGNSFSFYPTVTKVILDGVQQEQQQHVDTTVIECLPDTDMNNDDDDDSGSVDFAIRMLRRVESQQLGLEVLCSMTDSSNKKTVSQLLVTNDEFLKLVFNILKQNEAELRMSCLMLLWNIAKSDVVMEPQQLECIVPFLRSDQAQVVFLVAQCLHSIHEDIEIEEETLRQAHQLGQDRHHSALCRSVLSLSSNIAEATY